MQRARETFATGQRVVAAGQEFADDAPLVVAHAPMFDAVEEAPAPQRGTRKRAKAAAEDGGTEK